MPHEFWGLQNQPHEVFTAILIGCGVMAVAILLLVVYLRWKHPPAPKQPFAKGAIPRSRRKRRR